MPTATVYLSRRNLAALLSKLDRNKAAGERVSQCTLIKHGSANAKLLQSPEEVVVIAVEDEEYYTDRSPGVIHPADVKG